MRFRLRVDEVRPAIQAELVSMLERLSPRDYVFVKHVLPITPQRQDGNPHFHLYVDAPDITSVPALRYHVDKLKVKGAERSVKQCDEGREDEFIQYLFNRKHGNTSLLLSSTIDTTEHQARAAQVAEDFAKENPPKKEKVGPSMWQLATETLAHFRLTHPRMPSADYSADVYREMARSAIAVCQTHHKPVCDYMLQKLVQTALVQSEGSYRELVVNAVVRRLSPPINS